MTDDPYVYPGTAILRNKFEIRNRAALERVERRYVIQRTAEGIPTGDYDLAHLRAIHRHLFQDIYDWAGQVRTVEIGKDGQPFMLRRFIESGMSDVHRRLIESRYLRNLSIEAFAHQAGTILGDVNHIHPFREGNGRTQLQYLKQLGAMAGHNVELARLPAEEWIEASRRANDADYALMRNCIAQALGAEGRRRR